MTSSKKAMQADPEHRYQTAQALQTDVQSVLQAKPESKVGTDPQSKPGGKTGRWIAVFVGVLGLIAAAVFYPSASPPAAPGSQAKEESGGDILVEDEKGAALPVTITAQNFGAGLDVSVELQNVKNVVSGFGFHLALKKDGTLFVWGNNKNVEISLPVGLTDVIAIGAGSYATHALAVRADGSVVAWGTNTQGQCDVPPGLTDVVAVSGGRMHSLALKKDGSVVTWGGRGFDFVSAPSGLSDIIAISAGGLFNVALKKDGSVVAWGLNRVGQTDVPEGARSGVISISAGSEHALALKSDGSVIAWGHNSLGQATVPTEAKSDVIAIASGTLHSLALKSDGSVIAWGGKDTSIPTPTDFRARAITAAGIQSLGIIQRAAPLVLQGSGSVKTLKIKNRGNEKLTTATPLLYGTDVSDFVLDTSSLSNQIDPNGSQNLSITFRPTTAGSKSAFLRIPSDDPDTPHYDIPLTGTASNP
ncbi:MAG: choice-of-anchor D domain-containing protein [Verrucomicrobiaceae bacterium]|nr:choice-of-anchor D domain-containing protein [Verrucomicrobiaceae bacterium]